jgi:hypothetical protein
MRHVAHECECNFTVTFPSPENKFFLLKNLNRTTQISHDDDDERADEIDCFFKAYYDKGNKYK